VQKSVGNNLNDLFKEAPEKAEHIIARWKKTPPGKAREWIIRHGTRNQRQT
jgi:3-methyladenine DNA glycosylase AlkC